MSRQGNRDPQQRGRKAGDTIVASAWVYLGVAIVSEVVATSFLKVSDGFTKLRPSLIVAAGYAMAFFFLSLTLRSMSVGVAYALWSGVGIVLTAGIAWVAFDQKLDTAGFAGLGLIIAGVVVLNSLSKSAAH